MACESTWKIGFNNKVCNWLRLIHRLTFHAVSRSVRTWDTCRSPCPCARSCDSSNAYWIASPCCRRCMYTARPSGLRSDGAPNDAWTRTSSGIHHTCTAASSPLHALFSCAAPAQRWSQRFWGRACTVISGRRAASYGTWAEWAFGMPYCRLHTCVGSPTAKAACWSAAPSRA